MVLKHKKCRILIVRNLNRRHHSRQKRKELIEWIDRTPADCLKELEKFCTLLITKMDQRYENCVSPAAHTLGSCIYIPDIFKLVQGESSNLTAFQLASIQQYGKSEFLDFFSYICDLPHVKNLARSNKKLKLLPELAPIVHSCFKDVVVSVVWNNLGNCSKI